MQLSQTKQYIFLRKKNAISNAKKVEKQYVCNYHKPINIFFLEKNAIFRVISSKNYPEKNLYGSTSTQIRQGHFIRDRGRAVDKENYCYLSYDKYFVHF